MFFENTYKVIKKTLRSDFFLCKNQKKNGEDIETDRAYASKRPH